MISAQGMAAVLLIYGFMKILESINLMLTGVIHGIIQANAPDQKRARMCAKKSSLAPPSASGC
jgi:hypothetical protein